MGSGAPDSTVSAPARSAALGTAGDPGTRLLGGPPAIDGAEPYDAHLRRLGPLPPDASPADLRRLVHESGLTGRGGGQFPTAVKLDQAARAARGAVGRALVVVNSSEGEPASRKDRVLCELRPHLVLDGAQVAARSVGATEVVLYVHRHGRASRAIENAIAERAVADGAVTVPTGAAVRVVDAPRRYVAGETSAVVSYLGGLGALPRRTGVPAAVAGVGGRPTVVGNAETIAHLALVARHGAAWFREVGSPGVPGSTLLTLAGGVVRPGEVVEVLGPATIGEVLARHGGLGHLPSAVLVGGYEGTWTDGAAAWGAPLDRAVLSLSGVPLGCGLVAPLGARCCGIAETSRIVRWLAGESAGQCGPCVYGLPAVAGLLAELASGAATRRDLRRLRELTGALRGRGACGHPTGVAGLVESALDAFAGEVRAHLTGRACASSGELSGLPLPLRREGSGP